MQSMVISILSRGSKNTITIIDASKTRATTNESPRHQTWRSAKHQRRKDADMQADRVRGALSQKRLMTKILCGSRTRATADESPSLYGLRHMRPVVSANSNMILVVNGTGGLTAKE